MKILLPVDGSTYSTRAARYLVKHWPVDAAVTLLNVDAPLRESIAGHLDADSVARFHLDNGTAALKPARRVLAKAGHLFEERLLVGDPGTEILHLAQRGRYDLVVMGSHGRGVLKSLFLGSVVVKVLSGSNVPVLVVR
ncbi:universal stress protein [Dyella sp. BiH032]|uniref:universal stress protein n=1 Tax=Dyella sp. BiH032 TaxID=3075430 RepID=UPI002892F09F|nr:universal stress protein [Dyella sp. BiH032]WNL44021.1 universal stress protein [Dyella sp. BiH032]